jgi:hypothetical protein
VLPFLGSFLLLLLFVILALMVTGLYLWRTGLPLGNPNSTCPTRHLSAHPGMPRRWPPKPGFKNTNYQRNEALYARRECHDQRQTHPALRLRAQRRTFTAGRRLAALRGGDQVNALSAGLTLMTKSPTPQHDACATKLGRYPTQPNATWTASDHFVTTSTPRCRSFLVSYHRQLACRWR